MSTYVIHLGDHIIFSKAEYKHELTNTHSVELTSTYVGEGFRYFIEK